VLLSQLDASAVEQLLKECAKEDEKRQPTSQRISSTASVASSSSAAAGQPEGPSGPDVAMMATPAAVVAGERMVRFGAHRLLIEKFDFQRVSAPSMLCFGVHERLQLSSDAATDEEKAELKNELQQKITALSSGRREALLEQLPSVYQTTECVICLNASPDAVLYQCCHRCVHMRCIQKASMRRCPLCRARVVAILPDGQGTTSL